MADKRVRMVVEFDIDEESLAEKGLTADDVMEHIVLRDSEIDGFELSTNIPGFDASFNFFLYEGNIVSKEFVPKVERNAEKEEVIKVIVEDDIVQSKTTLSEQISVASDLKKQTNQIDAAILEMQETQQGSSMNLHEFLSVFDFDYDIVSPGGNMETFIRNERIEDGDLSPLYMDQDLISLIDLQGAYLGDIDKERYPICQESVANIIDRMDVYINDSIIQAFVDALEERGIDTSYLSLGDMVNKCKELYIDKDEVPYSIAEAILNPERIYIQEVIELENNFLLNNYEEACVHLCQKRNNYLKEEYDSEEFEPYKTNDCIPLFKSTNYIGIYYYNGDNEYYLVDRNNGKTNLILGDSFEFAGTNYLDCLKDEKILHVGNAEFLRYLIDYSYDNAKAFYPIEQLKGIAVLDTALRLDKNKQGFVYPKPSLEDQIQAISSHKRNQVFLLKNSDHFCKTVEEAISVYEERVLPLIAKKASLSEQIQSASDRSAGTQDTFSEQTKNSETIHSI